MWDAKNFKEVATLNGHKSSVISIVFSPDGTKIISGSRDNTIKVWTLKDFNQDIIKKEIALLEQQLQAKLEGIELKDTYIPYTKPLWSKYNPNYWLLKLEEAKTDKERAKYMLELGIIYDRDNQNQEALKWYKKAALLGNKEAKKRLEFLQNWLQKNKKA